MGGKNVFDFVENRGYNVKNNVFLGKTRQFVNGLGG